MSDLSLLEGAARAAGSLMTALRGGVSVRRKTDGSPVTNADLACDALLKRELMAARPDYGWLSEETADTADRLRARRVFIVDPIDGTTAYIKGRPWFAVSLAVVEDGRPVAGVVFAPELDELYAAEAGGGARLNDAPIRAADCGEIAGCSVVGDPGQFPAEAWPAISVTRRNALAYRLALVAAGPVRRRHLGHAQARVGHRRGRADRAGGRAPRPPTAKGGRCASTAPRRAALAWWRARRACWR